MSKDDELNIDILKKPSGRSFRRELDAAPQLLRVKDASVFFKLLLSHFLRGIDTKTGEEILICISKVLVTDRITETFLAGNFALALPFSQTQFTDAIFDVLYVLLQQSTDVFDEELSGHIAKMIPRNPLKTLILMSHYAQDFEEIANPWPFLDLLFKYRIYFQKPEFISEYVSLLAYLYRSYPDFRKERGKIAWETLCDLLSNLRDIQSLRCCYGGLAAIADGRMNVELPMEVIKQHLNDDALVSQVLSFMLVRAPKPPQSVDEDFIYTLIKLAHEDVKATLLLMKVATHKEAARLILVDSSWLLDGLPTVLDTLRVFFVILKHKGLREKISDLPDLIGFLKNMTEEADSATLALIVTILRRLVLSKEIVTELSRSGFLQDFLTAAKECGDTISGKSLLVLFSTIAPHAYVPEYLKMCDLIAREIVGDGDLGYLAADVAIAFGTYQKCVERMREKRLDAYFRKNRQDPDWAEYAESFLAVIGNLEEIDDRNYYSEIYSSSDSSDY